MSRPGDADPGQERAILLDEPVSGDGPEGPGPRRRILGRIRPTVRLRLTLWYAGLFFLAGVLLVALSYGLVRQSLVDAPAKARAEVAERYQIPLEQLEPPRHPGPEPPPVQVNGVGIGELIGEAQRELTNETLHQLLLMSGIALAVFLAMSVGMGWWMAGRMLRPLQKITETARHLSEVDLPRRRIALEGPRDELRELADTFDGMLARLDAAFAAQKEFVANASHELRTPLTIIRTEIDVALSDPDLSREDLEAMGTAVRDGVERSERLIDGLLFLAKTEQPLTPEPVDMAEVAQRQVEMIAATADAAGLGLELDLRQAPVTGDKALLERMVANVVDNAVRHNQQGGWFRVKTGVEGGVSTIEVSNSGIVVPPEEAGRLFERFYRLDRSRSRKTGGHGLGLSIVRSVAQAHRGTVVATPLPKGGLRIEVRLPASPSPGSSPAPPEVSAEDGAA